MLRETSSSLHSASSSLIPPQHEEKEKREFTSIFHRAPPPKMFDYSRTLGKALLERSAAFSAILLPVTPPPRSRHLKTLTFPVDCRLSLFPFFHSSHPRVFPPRLPPQTPSTKHRPAKQTMLPGLRLLSRSPSFLPSLPKPAAMHTSVTSVIPPATAIPPFDTHHVASFLRDSHPTETVDALVRAIQVSVNALTR